MYAGAVRALNFQTEERRERRTNGAEHATPAQRARPAVPAGRRVAVLAVFSVSSPFSPLLRFKNVAAIQFRDRAIEIIGRSGGSGRVSIPNSNLNSGFTLPRRFAVTLSGI